MHRTNALVLLAGLAGLAAAACGTSRADAPAAPAATPVLARTAPPPPAPAPAPPEASQDYVPAQFKNGASRWKDTGVYLDGKPIGFLTFGELPVTLQPTWVKDKVSQDKPPGSNVPAWRWAEERLYKFTDYLRAIGVDPRTVVAMHVYGPKASDSIVVTQKDLRSPLAQQFMFRFGGAVSGKAIPQVPLGFANGRTPDKITAVMIYVKKQPPRLVHNEGFELDGKIVEGVPYYGEPLRGGVRVYLDDRLAAIIKRQDLDDKAGVPGKDGAPRWSLYDFLHAHGVDTSKVVEGWAIRGDRRHEKLDAAALATVRFGATAQAKGQVTLGDDGVVAQVIALHTRAVKDSELPQIRPDEE